MNATTTQQGILPLYWAVLPPPDAKTVFKVWLATDANRDRIIDETDLTSQPFHFWVNDDDDVDSVTGDDKPGAADPDWVNGVVDGERDLIDFFPVFLNMTNLASYISPTSLVVRLSHAWGDLNYCCTDMTASNAGAYLISTNSSFPLSTAVVCQIPPCGVTLDQAFVTNMLLMNRGVILMEGRSPTVQPLVIEIVEKTSGTVICRKELALSISGVEDMFRHKNLRGTCGGSVTFPDRLGSPPNWPDSITTNKDCVLVHGYWVDEDTSRRGACEVFKRLFWSGSRARFHAITWRSDQWNTPFPPPLSFQLHSRNAYATALDASTYVNSLTGDVTVIAHSLGNQLVSSAIEDHAMTVAHYLMIAAAVPAETFDPTSMDTSSMVHPYWTGYSNRLWASEWHTLFAVQPSDDRNRLTWRDRFPSAVSNACNFYSPGDQVLEVTNATLSILAGITNIWTSDISRLAWWKQELLKGRFPVPVGSSTYGGWGFTSLPTMNYRHFPSLNLYSDAEMAAVSDAALRTEPFFCSGYYGAWSPSGIGTLYDAALGGGTAGSNYALNNRNRLIVEMIPSLSRPGGSSFVGKIETRGRLNFNLQTTDFQQAWPAVRPNTSWWHGDWRDVAYVYVWRLFDKFVTEGGLR